MFLPFIISYRHLTNDSICAVVMIFVLSYNKGINFVK